MAGEVLSKMLIKANKLGSFEVLLFGKEGRIVSHLQFADDTIVLLNGSLKSVSGVKRVLQCFQLLSSLKINFQKSKLYSCHLSGEELDLFADKLGCKVGR